jgi:hypothetical protein
MHARIWKDTVVAYFKVRLANLNAQDGHIIRKDSAESRNYVYIYRKVRGVEVTRTPLFTNTTFVLLLFIKVCTLRAVDLLHYVC